MKNSRLILIGVLLVIIILCIFIVFSKSSNTSMKPINVQFTKTFNVLADLQKTDQTGKYNYYVIQIFQEEPIAIKVNKQYILKSNKNYEFSFEGDKINNKNYSMYKIFNSFNIVKIEETDKERLDQRQDNIKKELKVFR